MNPPKKELLVHSPRTLAKLLNITPRPSLPKDSSTTEDAKTDYISKDTSFSMPPFPMDLPMSSMVPPLMYLTMEGTPISHSVPTNIVPILHPKYKVDDFFTDLETDLTNERFAKQINGISLKFPPPLAPFVPSGGDDPKSINDDAKARTPTDSEEDYSEEDDSEDENERGGIMVPFIYPPPPVINVDKLPYSKASFGIYTQYLDATTPTTRGRKPKKKGPEERQPQLVYLQVPPLPFPPANFMPYPLLAHKAALTPSDAFAAMIEANNNLPRVDMLVASAAGSIFDLKAQAEDEGFEAENFEKDLAEREKERERERRRERKIERVDDDSRKRKPDEDEFDSDEYNEYLDYVQSMERSEHYDIYDDDEELNVYTSEPRLLRFLKVKQKLSDSKRKIKRRNTSVKDQFDSAEGLNCQSTSNNIVACNTDTRFLPRDVALANGSNKEKRRLELKRSINQLEEFHENNRYEMYKNRKLQLLQRLHNLQKSRISFTNSRLYDQELDDFQQNLEVVRDEELVRVKLKANYELLESSLIFYQDSNRNYRHLNQLMVNKLEKLKNFFEFQRDLFTNYLKEDGELFNIGSKESTELYQSMVDKNYVQEVRDTLKKALDKGEKSKNFKSFKEKTSSARPSTSPTPTQHSDSPDEEILYRPTVHDFMPLITAAEFNMITGDLPSKAKSIKDTKSKTNVNLKHKIFQNPLYERGTSGSDTNQSESTAAAARGAPNRRGRRAGPANVVAASPNPSGYAVSNTLANSDKYKGILDAGPDNKYTEATLLAKIMKLFNGPQMANPEEVVNDLDLMGVRSMWNKQ